jgi:hypothetical protein
MSARRLLVAALVGGSVYTVLAYLMFNVVFAELFAQNAGSATGVPRADLVWWAIVLGNVSLAFLVALCCNWARATTILQGCRIGATVGFLIWLGTDSLQYGLTNLWKPAILIIDPVLSAIPYSFIGGLIVLTLGKRTELAASRGRQAV